MNMYLSSGQANPLGVDRNWVAEGGRHRKAGPLQEIEV